MKNNSWFCYAALRVQNWILTYESAGLSTSKRKNEDNLLPLDIRRTRKIISITQKKYYILLWISEIMSETDIYEYIKYNKLNGCKVATKWIFAYYTMRMSVGTNSFKIQDYISRHNAGIYRLLVLAAVFLNKNPMFTEKRKSKCWPLYVWNSKYVLGTMFINPKLKSYRKIWRLPLLNFQLSLLN